MPSLTVPAAGLVVLVGPAGSGKTTFATRHFAADEILGSDAFRAMISGDEADQRATAPAFAALHRQLERRLAAGALSVVDATNIERHARVALLDRARAARRPAAVIVFDLPPAVVVSRNAARAGRVVDPSVVARHLARLRATVDRGAIEAEGFDPVYRLRAPREVDAVTIARRGAATGQPGAARRTTRPKARARTSTQTPLRR